MNNKFINNNGVNLLQNSKNKKTKVEIQSIVGDQSQIAELKQQEQAIIKDLVIAETKSKKVDKLLSYLSEVDKFSTRFLTEAVETEKAKENPNDWWLEHLIKDKVEFALKFESASKSFYELILQKIENQISHLKSQLRTIQEQLAHQERIFARIEIRRQGKVLLDCELNNRLGCLGVYRCANCKVNYSDNQRFQEVSSP